MICHICVLDPFRTDISRLILSVAIELERKELDLHFFPLNRVLRRPQKGSERIGWMRVYDVMGRGWTPRGNGVVTLLPSCTPFATFALHSDLLSFSVLYLTHTLPLSHLFVPTLRTFSGLPMPFSSIVL